MENIEDKEFKVAAEIIDDCRKYLAAGKVQRWDVMKWGVSVNLGLATASAAMSGTGFYFLLLNCLISFAGWLLILHYNRRMTKIRETSVAVVAWMKSKGVDYEAISKIDSTMEYSAGQNYDREELRLFALILAVSPAATLLRLFLLP
jgi:hypothetical protein